MHLTHSPTDLVSYDQSDGRRVHKAHDQSNKAAYAQPFDQSNHTAFAASRDQSGGEVFRRSRDHEKGTWLRAMLERDVIRKTLAGVKHLRIPHIRMTMMQGASAGWPDYLFILPNGRSLWIEFKAPGKKPTKLQKHRMAILAAQGHRCAVVDNPEHGIAVIEAEYEASKRT